MIQVWLFVHRFELRPCHVEGGVLWLKKLLGQGIGLATTDL